MNTHIGAKEIYTQKRVIQLFKNQLGYAYLGDWKDREGNSNIEEELLRSYLSRAGKYVEAEITGALYQLKQAADNISSGLYNANKAVYGLLRYGVNVNVDVTKNSRNVHLINWENPAANNFYVAEEVTVRGRNTKRPDLVVYVNGIALAVIELKRSTQSVHHGIRQNLDNQTDEFIPQFFTTVQLLFAGNDTEGLRFGTIGDGKGTPEKFWMRWKEHQPDVPNELDRSVLQFFSRERFLEFIHDCLLFDGGVKKAARPNQYFALKAAQTRVRSKEGGIIWHSQGSGKSLTMVWLAKWIRENINDARVIIITDRDELDKQITAAFKDADIKPERALSGDNLIQMLNKANPWLICTLIHKFGVRNEGDTIEVGGRKATKSLDVYLQELARKLPQGFKVKGNIFVFVDECHRTQGGMLHQAMKSVMGDDVMMIGFTGTPLLRTDKKTTLETFGSYIHTYKYNEAVEDKVIRDLRYEARDVSQYLGNREKLDEWFEQNTAGLSKTAKSLLKERWVKLEKLFSSKERMQRIIADICEDMIFRKPALQHGYGNAILVADSIYQACRYWELFQDTELKGHCAAVTSYEANAADIKDEATGAGETEEKVKYEITKRMMGDKTPEKYEEWAKEEFKKHPANMKLLIVVDKLLTGFDAPFATYLYIDKKMRDHNLFQAICRVNRVEEEKDFGYIIDYQDLFKVIQNAIEDYTSEVFDGYEKEDVTGLLTSRLEEGRKALEAALQAVVTLCEVVVPQTREAFYDYFVYRETTPIEKQNAECEANAEKREKLYKLVNTLVRRFIDIANEMKQAGYTPEESATIKRQIDFYNDLKDEIRLKSGDALDLKRYDPAMRQLIDNYVRAEDSEVLLDMEDISFLDLIAAEGENAIGKLPKNIRNNERYVTETLAANMRKMIINERHANPAYYDKISELLHQLLQEQKEGKIQYKELIEKLIAAIQEMRNRKETAYPSQIDTAGKQALYDNLDKDIELTLRLDNTVKTNAKHGWRDHNVPAKMKQVRHVVSQVLQDFSTEKISEIMEIIIMQKEY